MSARIEKLKHRLAAMPPAEICFERARLMTRSYRETEGEPVIIRRAKAFATVLEGLPIAIAPDELVVGHVASRPRVAYFAPETFNWRNYRTGSVHEWSDHRFSKSLNIRARIPDEVADYWRNQPTGGTAGHFVADYERVLLKGFRGLCHEGAAHQARLKAVDREAELFYQSARIVGEAAMRFGQRHAQTARDAADRDVNPTRQRELLEIAAICEKVPAHPAESFREAIQSFWLTHVMLHINSQEWSISPGRFDCYLRPFYEKDIADGRLTREQAKELLACLWMKFNELRIAVDFVNYQNLLVGGVDAAGDDVTNDLSFLCLETTAEMRTIQPSLSMRWHPGTPEALLRKAGEMTRSGIGFPAMFNDVACISALRDAGVSVEDARNYAIAGCEELAVPGKLFGVMRGGQINLAQCLLRTLFGSDSFDAERVGATRFNRECRDFPSLLSAYKAEVKEATRQQMAWSKQRDRANVEFTPHPFVSLLFDDCLEKGRDITRSGARYNITSFAEAGSITAADSLAAIRQSVYEEKVIGLAELKRALEANYRGYDWLRQYLLNKTPKFGNDDPAMDRFVCEIVEMNHEAIQELNERDGRGGVFATGSGGSTAWLAGAHTGATPDGRRAGEALSVCLGPSRGADRRGPTAMLKSVSRLKWEHQVGGALIHIRMPLGALEGEESMRKLASLIKTFFLAGGMGLHFTVVDAAMLRDAQKQPDRHPGLLVRVGGFSAPFVLLSRDIQDNIIQRTEHGLDDSGDTSPMSG
ncbi:MAG: hypothetical protein FJ279_21890 [Planctomycetes bacterium]|nr:hypothetical protein [Planctomycetota bacterium]